MEPRRKYRILILTDHRIHSPVESIYPIARQMSKWEQCAHIDVVSRGLISNKDFFERPHNSSVRAVRVTKEFQHHENGASFKGDNLVVQPINYDVVLLRLPRVNSMDFFNQITNTIPARRIINQPAGIMATGSKDYLLNFPDLCPPMQLCTSVEDVLEFKSQFPVVIKPLNNSGGKGIIRIDGDSAYIAHSKTPLAEVLPVIEQEVSKGYLAVKFLKNVNQGDKRIIVANGKVVSAAVRIPAEGSWLANVSMGASSVPAEPDEDELEIVNRVSPDLKSNGVVLFGIDTLVDDSGKRVLSELNTSCVNGIYPAEMISGKPIVQRTVDLLIDYIQQNIEPRP